MDINIDNYYRDVTENGMKTFLSNGKIGIQNIGNGKKTIPSFDRVIISNRYIFVEVNGRWGILGLDLNLITPSVYEEIYPVNLIDRDSFISICLSNQAAVSVSLSSNNNRPTHIAIQKRSIDTPEGLRLSSYEEYDETEKADIYEIAEKLESAFTDLFVTISDKEIQLINIEEIDIKHDTEFNDYEFFPLWHYKDNMFIVQNKNGSYVTSIYKNGRFTKKSLWGDYNDSFEEYGSPKVVLHRGEFVSVCYPEKYCFIGSPFANKEKVKEFEEKIESLRQSLYQQNNFTSKSLFNYLDNPSKSFISLDDFIKFLQDNSINYDEKYLRQFIHNYDKDNDFSINYQEFKGIITPLTDDSYKEKEEIKNEEINNFNMEKEEDAKKKNNNNNNENKDENKDENTDKNKDENDKNENKYENKKENQIEPDILKMFIEILIQEMSLAEKTTEIAKQCIGSKFFTFYESFREIADDEKYITEENINNFFKRNCIELNEKEAKGLIHRNDRDNDGKISFSEYKEIFYPLNNVQYKRSAKDYNKYLDE